MARRYRSLQQLYRWLFTEGEIKVNPMANMDPPRVVDQPPEVLTDAEIKALLKSLPGSRPSRARRAVRVATRHRDGVDPAHDRDSGVRADRAHRRGPALQRRDVPRARQGRTRTKRDAARAPAEAVDRYLRARRKHPEARKTNRLWIGEKGPLSDSGLRQMLARRCDAAGIRRVNPHLFRHTFAHHAKQRGMADESLMAIAGWNTARCCSATARPRPSSARTPRTGPCSEMSDCDGGDPVLLPLRGLVRSGVDGPKDALNKVRSHGGCCDQSWPKLGTRNQPHRFQCGHQRAQVLHRSGARSLGQGL